ncbi:unnamed protein product [Paramecium pentaurelia]|uniref:FCP1 homology domain-containing protein n=1 Tax=Paramecium pentaurelia TaxID=43138 RepID=A0A8S1T9H8_9CILI|nr:unnamed protein product [Paramecium pentaurelia]
MVSTCSLIAFIRNEINLFWTGNFYDEILLDPFKNELDKKSVKLIRFFNIGTEQSVNICEPYELVKADKEGDLKLDSILFDGLQSFKDINSDENVINKKQQNTFDNQQQQDIQTQLRGVDPNNNSKAQIVRISIKLRIKRKCIFNIIQYRKDKMKISRKILFIKILRLQYLVNISNKNLLKNLKQLLMRTKKQKKQFQKLRKFNQKTMKKSKNYIGMTSNQNLHLNKRFLKLIKITIVNYKIRLIKLKKNKIYNKIIKFIVHLLDKSIKLTPKKPKNQMSTVLNKSNSKGIRMRIFKKTQSSQKIKNKQVFQKHLQNNEHIFVLLKQTDFLFQISESKDDVQDYIKLFICRQGISDNYRSIITIDKENSYALLQKKKQYQNRESSNSSQQKNENRSNSGLFKSASLQQFYRAQSAVEKNSYQNYKGNQLQINQMKNVSYLSLLQQSGYQLKHNYTKSTKELNNKWIDFLSNENQRQKPFENQAYKRLNEKLEYLEKKFHQLKDSFANVSENQQDKKTDRIKQKQYSMVSKYFPQKFIQQQKNVSQEESKVKKDIKSIFNIYSQMKDIKSYTSNSQLLKQSQDKNTGLLQDFVTQIKRNSNKNSQLLKGSQINQTNSNLNKSERQQSMDSKYFYLNKISETQPNEPFLYYISTVIQAIKSKKPTELDELIKEHFSQTYQGLIYANRLVIQFDPNKVIYLPKSNHLKTIVFDLDETLIHCNSNLSIQGDIILPITFPNNETIQASINIRPYAKQILKTLSKDFEIIIFTASHSCYANMVIDYLDPKKQWISHRLFREHCIQTREGAYIKDLRILGNRKLCNVLLVDNASYSFNKQIENGIPIISYYDNKEDQELLHLENYLLNFRSVKDVRDLNQKQLKLKQFLDYSDFDDLQNNLKDIYF